MRCDNEILKIKSLSLFVNFIYTVPNVPVHIVLKCVNDKLWMCVPCAIPPIRHGDVSDKSGQAVEQKH